MTTSLPCPALPETTVAPLDWQKKLPEWTRSWKVRTTLKLATHSSGIQYTFEPFSRRRALCVPLRVPVEPMVWRASLVGGVHKMRNFLQHRPAHWTAAYAQARLDRLCNEAVALWRHVAWDACMDCGLRTSAADEYYMVHKPLWLTANSLDDGMLCIGCLEERLGRELTPADFTTARVNGADRDHSPRLQQRLGHLTQRPDEETP